MKFREISDVLRPSLRSSALDAHVTRVWIYRDICLVVDFLYKGVRFAFDLTPSAKSQVSVDLVQRKSESGFRATTGGAKDAVARDIELADAVELLQSRAREILSSIDRYSAADGVPPGLGKTATILPAATSENESPSLEIEERMLEDISKKYFGKDAVEKSRLNLLRNIIYDDRRFFKYSGVFKKKSIPSARGALITKYYHVIEKGLSLPEPRPGFGEEQLKNMARVTEAAIRDRVCEREVRLAIDALSAYRQFNERHGIESFPWLTHVLDFASANGFFATGQATRDAYPLRGGAASGLDLIFSRSSVRNYSSAPVPEEVLQLAIRAAQAAPCVCNRQAGRVYLIKEPKMKAAVLQLQNGNRGFGLMAPVIAILTTDLSEMLEPTERYQHWIDGGMFAQNFLLGIHAQGYGACPLNWSASWDKDLALRRLGFIPDSESVLMMVSIGALKASYKVARSERRLVESVTKIL